MFKEKKKGKSGIPIQLSAVPSFDPSGIQIRFRKDGINGENHFFYYIEASGSTNDVLKRNTPLHLVGIETHEIFETLQGTGNTYD